MKLKKKMDRKRLKKEDKKDKKSSSRTCSLNLRGTQSQAGNAMENS